MASKNSKSQSFLLSLPLCLKWVSCSVIIPALIWLILSTMLSILLKHPAPFAENIFTFVAGLSTDWNLFLLVCVFGFLILFPFVLLASLALSFFFDSGSFFPFDSFCLGTEENP